MDDNGMRLIDLCESMPLKILNGFFSHEKIHKFTWTKQTKRLKSIIDSLILRKNSKLNNKEVMVFRGSEYGTDHQLLIAKVVNNYSCNDKESR